MKKRPRIYYSAKQRALIWERWRKGETLHQIARLFDRYHSSIQRIVAESGGIRPTERRRSRAASTLIEREEISRGVVSARGNPSDRGDASAAHRLRSAREIRRNEGAQGYRAGQADSGGVGPSKLVPGPGHQKVLSIPGAVHMVPHWRRLLRTDERRHNGSRLRAGRFRLS